MSDEQSVAELLVRTSNALLASGIISDQSENLVFRTDRKAHLRFYKNYTLNQSMSKLKKLSIDGGGFNCEYYSPFCSEGTTKYDLHSDTSVRYHAEHENLLIKLNDFVAMDPLSRYQTLRNHFERELNSMQVAKFQFTFL